MYENIIFEDEDEDDGDTQAVEEDLMDDEQGSEAQLSPLSAHLRQRLFSDRTTLAIWATTTQPERENDSANKAVMRTSILSRAASSSWQNDNLETQEGDEHSANTHDTYSNTSSIARFPGFQFSLGTLSALASARGKTCLLLAVLEVDGPDEVTVRRGPDAGCVVSVLRLIVGDEASTICKLTAWREVAQMWGGTTTDAAGIRVRRGDVVYFESALSRLRARPHTHRTPDPRFISLRQTSWSHHWKAAVAAAAHRLGPTPLRHRRTSTRAPRSAIELCHVHPCPPTSAYAQTCASARATPPFVGSQL
jgi:hypothetical protein